MPIKSKCCDSPIAVKCMKCKQMCETVETFSSVWYTAKPKIGFPHYVTKGIIFKKKVPFGWEDRGKVGLEEIGAYQYKTLHNLCNERIKIGIDKSGTFRFCPKCLVKLKP